MKVATNEWEKTRAISVVRGRRQEPPTRGRRWESVKERIVVWGGEQCEGQKPCEQNSEVQHKGEKGGRKKLKILCQL